PGFRSFYRQICSAQRSLSPAALGPMFTVPPASYLSHLPDPRAAFIAILPNSQHILVIKLTQVCLILAFYFVNS
ncbi:MAG: hypothetical protein L7W43_16565, partial [Rubripirellula sp.]|nr:hypothetical protein [Rubripirellula sp.]